MKYIDADKFEKECMFDKNCNDMQDVIYKLRDHPAADVVEVVRCKDCKYFVPINNDDHGICGGRAVYDDDFCSDGEWVENG